MSNGYIKDEQGLKAEPVMNSLEKIDQVIINLKVISTLTDGERLCLRNNNFSVYSPGWSQAVFRWMFGETRWVNMEDVKMVISDAIRILGTYINLVHHAYTPVADDRFSFAVPTPQTCFGFVSTMARELRAATKGLASLKQTYTGDQLITATFDLLIERTMLEIQKADETMITYQSMSQTPGMLTTTVTTSTPVEPAVRDNMVVPLTDVPAVAPPLTSVTFPSVTFPSVTFPSAPVQRSLVSKHYGGGCKESHFDEDLEDDEETNGAGGADDDDDDDDDI